MQILHDLENLEALLKFHHFHASALVLETLSPSSTPTRVALRSDAAIYPASMIKLPIAVAVAYFVSIGKEPRGPLVVDDRVMTGNDAPSPLQPGYRSNVWELCELMLSRSDNIATNMLIDAFPRTESTAYLQSLGLQHTAIRRFLSGSAPRIADPETTGENEHSAADCVVLLRGIADKSLPFAERLYKMLADQWWNTKLSAGLDEGDHFAHKTGDTNDVSHDGGILSTASGKHYLIALFSPRPSHDDTDRDFAAFMRSLRPLLGERPR